MAGSAKCSKLEYRFDRVCCIPLFSSGHTLHGVTRIEMSGHGPPPGGSPMDFPGAAISTFSCHYLPLSLCSLPCFLASLVSLFVPELRLFLLLLPRVHLHLELRLPRILMFDSSRQSYTLSLKRVWNVMLCRWLSHLHSALFRHMPLNCRRVSFCVFFVPC